MSEQTGVNVSEQVSEQTEQTVTRPAAKVPFMEPMISTPEDVLEATTLFQGPTVDVSTL